MAVFRNAGAFSMIITSFFVIFSVSRISIELDAVLAFLLLLIIMFCLFVIMSMMYLIFIHEQLRKISINLSK